MGTYIKIYNNAKQKYLYQSLLLSFPLFFSFLFFSFLFFSFFCYIKEGVGGEGEGKGTGLFKFIESFNL
jgi:hypothetical protein